MSYADGWAALNLEMPVQVPRTEYSADFHWDLIREVTGIPVSLESDSETRTRATRQFYRDWDYAFVWSILVDSGWFGDVRTRMGHAEYAAGGEDWDATVTSPFKTYEDVLAFRPLERLPKLDLAETTRRFEAHYQANVLANPDTVNMTGVYVTCISGLIDLFGWDLLLEAMGDDPVRMGELTREYGEWISVAFEALARADVPCVMVHDDLVWTSGPIFHPSWYREYVFPHLQRCIRPLAESGKRVIFTADGNYTAFIDDIVATGVHSLVMEPTTDMALIAERYGRTHSFVGNVDTRILLSGPESAIDAEVERCMAIGKDCPGFILAVGNHIPPNTPVSHAQRYDATYRRLRER